MHIAVDSLWGRATKTNIEALARELTATKERGRNKKLMRGPFFLKKRHLKELNKLFKILENFRAGKIRLIEIGSREDMGYVFPDVIRDQIEQNRSFKEDCEKLLEELRVSFKSRLSEIEEPEFA